PSSSALETGSGHFEASLRDSGQTEWVRCFNNGHLRILDRDSVPRPRPIVLRSRGSDGWTTAICRTTSRVRCFNVEHSRSDQMGPVLRVGPPVLHRNGSDVGPFRKSTGPVSLDRRSSSIVHRTGIAEAKMLIAFAPDPYRRSK